MNTYTLSNGIRLLHLADESPVASCGFAVNAGTRDELEHEHGMAHFTEHMLFKGTDHRKSWHIINRLESVGGELDAYTTKEETFVYATVPSLYTERAVELLSDLLFHSVFPANEMEREMDVIVDEIQSYNDSPAELIYDDFEGLLFGDAPIGRTILGTEESLKNINPSMMREFQKRCYTTDQMVFFYMGNLPFERLIKMAERYFDVPASQRDFVRQAPQQVERAQKELARDTYQTHCLIGNRAYSLDDARRVPLVLLNNILGGPRMSSRLNMSIRERNGLAYTIESTLTSYSDTSVWAVYFGCDNSNTKRCTTLVERELRYFVEHAVEERQLAAYKRQVAGQLLIVNQNKENRLLSAAKIFLHLNHCFNERAFQEQMEAVTAKELHEVANEVIALPLLTKLYYQ